MKLSLRISVLFLLFFTAAISLNIRNSDCAVVDKIVAVVNDEVITQREVDALLFSVFTQLSATYEGEELEERLRKARQDAIQQLIDNKLVLSEAKKQKIIVSEEEITELIDETKANFASEVEFEEALDSQSLRLIDLKERYKEQVMLKKIIDKIIRKEVSISPGEYISYYQSHPDQFKKPLEVKVGLILIKVNDAKDEKTKLGLAKQILGQLNSGADFAQLAKKYSQGPRALEGGDLGFVKRGHMTQDLDKVIFSLEKGQVSDIVNTKLGYNIIKIYDIHPEEIKALDEARPIIEQMLYQKKTKLAVEDWISKLKKNAYISIK